MQELKKMIEAFLGKELDAEVVAKAAPDEEVLKMLKAQLQLIEKYRADLPIDVAVVIGTLSQHAAFGIQKSESTEDSKDKETEDTKEEKKEEVTVESVIDSAVEKAMTKVNEGATATAAKLDEICKALEAIKQTVEKSTPKQEESVEKKEEVKDEVDAATFAKMVEERVAKVSGKA